MEQFLPALMCATVLILVTIAFISWVLFIKIHNLVVDILNRINKLPGDVKKSASGVVQEVKNQKPPLPADLDQLTETLIAMAKNDWISSADLNTATLYYHILSQAAQYMQGKWYAEIDQDTKTLLLWVRLSKGTK